MKSMMIFAALKHLKKHKYGSGLLLMNINISSILSHIDELRILAEDYQPHIIGVNKTKLDDLILDNELRIYGYRVIIRKDMNRQWRWSSILC